MSLDIVKKNSSSPFQLQRSMVDQGGEGGAYESGGYNPAAVYNNDAANQAVESFGKLIGAGLSARPKDEPKEKTKEVDPKTVKAQAAKEFKVKANSELTAGPKVKDTLSEATNRINSGWRKKQ